MLMRRTRARPDGLPARSLGDMTDCRGVQKIIMSLPKRRLSSHEIEHDMPAVGVHTPDREQLKQKHEGQGPRAEDAGADAMLAPDFDKNAGRREPAALSEIALTGVYEISKILTSPARLEVTLANVLNLLSSFMQMRDGIISLLDDDSLPEIVVGAGWREDAEGHPRPRIPEKAVGQIIATSMPLVVQNIATHPLFDKTDVEALQSDDGATVSFIGVPIRAEGKVVGTLTIDRIWDGAAMFRFDSDVRFLAMIANLVGQTIQLHRVVARDRERLMAESHRLQKELSEFKPPTDSVRADGILGDSEIGRAS